MVGFRFNPGMSMLRMKLWCGACILIVGLGGGCSSPPGGGSAAPPTVSRAMARRDQPTDARSVTYRERSPETPSTEGPAATSENDAVAEVNGHPISRKQLIELLIRSRGADVLQQLIAYETAEANARKRGITITAADVAFERRLAAERIWNPLAPFTSASLDEKSADKLLDTVIAQKRISPDEFDLVLRRNAYLRRIIEHDKPFTELDYQAEYDRAYGERVRVRHIQLATTAEVARIQERLDAGDSFEDLARKYSANQASAKNGGLLEPFARSEDRIPEIFRQTAFALKPGTVSGAVHAGDWYQLIRVEERLPAEHPKMADVKDELTRRLRERLSDQAMYTLYEKLVGEATIEVFDPLLREVYLAAQGSHGGQRSGSQ